MATTTPRFAWNGSFGFRDKKSQSRSAPPSDATSHRPWLVSATSTGNTEPMLTRQDLRTVLIEALTGAADALRNAQLHDPSATSASSPPEVLAPATEMMNGRLTLNVSEAAEMLGIGRTGAYKLLNSGELHSVRVGGRVLIPVQALRDFLALAKAR